MLKRLLLLAVLASTVATAAAPTFAQCWGAKGSTVYHSSQSCPAYKRIKSGNLVTFSSEDAAKKDGRHLCKRCH